MEGGTLEGSTYSTCTSTSKYFSSCIFPWSGVIWQGDDYWASTKKKIHNHSPWECFSFLSVIVYDSPDTEKETSPKALQFDLGLQDSADNFTVVIPIRYMAFSHSLPPPSLPFTPSIPYDQMESRTGSLYFQPAPKDDTIEALCTGEYRGVVFELLQLVDWDSVCRPLLHLGALKH